MAAFLSTCFLMLLVAQAIPCCRGSVNDDSFDLGPIAVVSVSVIGESAHLFRHRSGRWPTLEELRLERSLDDFSWHDPWGHVYRVSVDAADQFVVESSGPDGQPGTDDDVRSVRQWRSTQGGH